MTHKSNVDTAPCAEEVPEKIGIAQCSRERDEVRSSSPRAAARMSGTVTHTHLTRAHVREALFYHIKSATCAPPTHAAPSHARAPDNKHIHLGLRTTALRRLARLGRALTHHCLDNLLLLDQECANDAASGEKKKRHTGCMHTHRDEHTCTARETRLSTKQTSHPTDHARAHTHTAPQLARRRRGPPGGTFRSDGDACLNRFSTLLSSDGKYGLGIIREKSPAPRPAATRARTAQSERATTT